MQVLKDQVSVNICPTAARGEGGRKINELEDRAAEITQCETQRESRRITEDLTFVSQE